MDLYVESGATALVGIWLYGDNAGIITSFSIDLSLAQFQFKRRTFSKFDAQKLIRYNEPFLIILFVISVLF